MWTRRSKMDIKGLIKASFFFLTFAAIVWTSKMRADELKTPGASDIINDLKATGVNQQNDDLRSLQAEMLIAKNEKRAMKQIQKLLRKYRGHAMEPGLWFRLAELYMRRAKADRFFEVNRESETLVKLAPKLVKKASAKSNIKKAISIYDKVERKFPYFRDMDLVLFNSGFARQQIGRNVQARKLYRKLIHNFSDSPLVPDSHLAIGEMLFEEKNFKAARKEFEAIKQYPQSRIYPYGRYKLSWALYNLEEVAQGLTELEAVVSYSKAQSSEDSRRLDLRTEALSDMVLFYSEVKPADKAVSYFIEQASKEKAGFYTLKLMRLYNRHGKLLKEKQVFYNMVSDLPQDEYLPKAYVAMVDSFESQRKRDLAVFELERFGKLCSLNSTWYKNPENKKENCVELVSKLSSNYAAKWHKLWRKNQFAVEVAEYAERAYRNYLSFALKGEKASTVHYEYANLLFQRKKFRKASVEYFAVANKVKKQPMLHDSSYASIFSLQKAVKDKWNKEDELRYVELASHYLGKNPKGKYREDIEFKRAFIIYDNERYDEAAPLLADLGERYKHKKQGIRAQDLYLDILAKKKDFITTKTYSHKLLKREKSKKRKATLKKVYQESYFASIEVDPSEEKKKTSKQKATEYIEFAKANMDSPLAEQAWWNAVGIQKETIEFNATADLAYSFYKKFSGSKLSTDALKIATQNYERVMKLKEAAKTSELLVVKDKKNASDWARLAIEYYIVEGEYKKAQALLKEQLNAPKKQTQKWAIEQLYKLAQVTKNKEQEDYYGGFLVKLNIQPYAVQFKLKDLDELVKNKKWPAAFKLGSEILRMKGDISYYKGKARYVQAQILKDEFDRQSMLARPDRAALVIALKTEKLEKAQRAFQSAAKYKNPEVVLDSMVALSELYGIYAKDLRGMKLKGVEEKDAAAFYQEIENLVIPMEERQVDAMAQALEAAKELKLGNEQLLGIRRKMDKLNMQQKYYFEVETETPKLLVPDLSGVGS